VLLVAALITLIVGEWIDFALIITLVLVNSTIGFWQELKAEASIKALQQLTENKSNVLRDGKIVVVPSSLIVPGDVLILGEGDLVTADLRLFESSSLMVDEAPMTGESVPVTKDHSLILNPSAMPYELKNMLLTGTTIVRGFGRGVVTATGCQTYLAGLAEKAKEASPESPLTRSLKVFIKKYIIILLSLFIAIGIYDYWLGRPLFDIAYIIVAQLVSAVPEGLPIVVTVIMVAGAVVLSKKKTLTRYLPAVETLGSATVIASDKTGTITEGKLLVKCSFSKKINRLKIASALCNDSNMGIGDPLDVALANWVKNYENIRKKYPQAWSYPFDTKLKLMASVNEIGGKKRLIVKGAFEELQKLALNKSEFAEAEESLKGMANNGLRVVAFGEGVWTGNNPSSWRLNLLGLVGFLDPPKSGVKEAVLTAKRAGIRVIMITGDYPLTAKAVAKEVGIWSDGDSILTGEEVAKLNDNSLFEAMKKTTVLARIIPEQKYRIVKLLQSRGEVVAVTGDGVNDVPALKAADLGVAMGSGTEAAKGVAKMVIVDNNLGIIVDAIRTGRVTADNVRKVIYYLLSTNMHQIFLLAMAIFSGLPLPLYPIMILWINLVTDGTQDKTFPFIKAEDNVMDRSPVKPGKQFFDLKQLLRILFFGLVMGFASYMLYVYLLNNYSYEFAVSVTFVSVVVPQWINGIQAQKEREPFFRNIRRSFSINPYIYVGAGIGLGLQLIAIYLVPYWFRVEPLPIDKWIYPIAISGLAFFALEARKIIEFYFLKTKK
jgi:Ca2+-transporting ATPase